MKTRAVILAGGEGSRLGVLTAKRTKPAVPFGGKYRIIDFALSNCVNSGIFDVMLLAQYRPHSLIEHIGAGGPWDLNRDFTGGVRIYTPYKGRGPSDWYVGTADAVQQNFSFVKNGSPDLVLILSGDHIYEMNYDAMIAFHRDHGAVVTLATISVPISEASRFGIVGTDHEYRVTSFIEKPSNPASNRVNMGVYLFNMDVLDRVLWEDHHRSDSSHDFGKNILPCLIEDQQPVYAYPYTGYWVDVGTLNSYWQAHMDLLCEGCPFDLNDRTWIIHTRTEERPPVWIARNARIEDSMICDGCEIAPGAQVIRSVLSPGVRVEAGAVVRESILLSGAVVETGAVVERAIVDKRAYLGGHCQIGALATEGAPLVLTTIGKNSVVPAGFIVEPGAMIGTDVIASDYDSLNKRIPSHTQIHTKRPPYEF
ncbi:MAG: glucose-1-phosphate adenylyltransferase family protein [Chloroflexota bacterium]